LRGALFETWVVTELVKERFNAGQPADLYFWRDNIGHEVDVVFEAQGRLQPVEIKSGATFVTEWLAGVRKWVAIAGDDALPPIGRNLLPLKLP
jgi:predicted AAA+ superfamily ATPase